jgi:hypothetical protein
MTSQTQQDLLLSTIGCVVHGKIGTYVSGPISTGIRFNDWIARLPSSIAPESDAYAIELRQQVMRPNESAILKFAARLESRGISPVVEPASLSVQGWQQNDYHHFWTSVLDRFIKSVFVVDGWQFSIGCAIEVQWAIAHDVSVRSENETLLATLDCSSLLSDASKLMKTTWPTNSTLAGIANQLSEAAATIAGYQES